MLTKRYAHQRLVNKWPISSGVKGQYFDSGGRFKAKGKVALEADPDGPESVDFFMQFAFSKLPLFPYGFHICWCAGGIKI